MDDASRLKPLRLAIHGVNAPFYCAGNHVPENPVALKFKDGTQFVVERTADRFKQAEALKPLINRCRPATFGDKRRTRLNRDVRDARQLMAEKGDFRVEHFDPELAGILEAIRRELLPPDSPPVTAELYALNIYTEGGHFAPHKDTPRGKEMFGTLVVCLPSRFWSGQLTLTHRGVVQQFDWGSAVEKQMQATQVHWAAFFGDVDHQIERVWGGARVTLTYLLRREGNTLPSRTIANANLAPAIQAAWQDLLADASFMPKGGTIGYPCCHLYHQDARFQVKREPLEQQSANMLKGRDQLVAATALKAGLDVTFAPYLFENSIDETWQLDRFPTQQEKRKLSSHMDLDGLESALPIVGESSEKSNGFGVTWLEDPPPCNVGSRLDSADEEEFDDELFDDEQDRDVERASGNNSQGLPAAERLHSCEYCEWGYFGNESSYVDFYIYAALHIRMPSLGEGARVGMRTKTIATRRTAGATSKKRPVKKMGAVTQKSAESAMKPAKKPLKKRASKTPKRKRAAE